MFEKAKPQQAFLKVAGYGPPGSGKTFTTLLMAEGIAAHRGKRIAYIDTERGTDFYAIKTPRDVHPEAFDFDCVYTRSLFDVLEAVRGLDPAEHGVIVLDSVTHLWEAAIAAYEGKMTSADTIPMQAWGKIKKPYKELVAFLMDAPFDVFILGREKNLFENSSDGQLKKVGVGMKAEGETAYEPHICWRHWWKQGKDGGGTYFITAEKDRTGVLAGRTIANPCFETIAPLLPLLGSAQAQAEDPEEVAARDGELITAQEEKQAKKESKSLDILAEYQGRIHAAATLEEFAAIKEELGKKKRYMLPEHVTTLGLTFTQKLNQVTGNG